MSDIVKRKCHSFDNPALSLEGGGLWRYVPVSNSDNKAFCDFMVLLPGIKKNRTLQVMIRQAYLGWRERSEHQNTKAERRDGRQGHAEHVVSRGE